MIHNYQKQLHSIDCKIEKLNTKKQRLMKEYESAMCKLFPIQVGKKYTATELCTLDKVTIEVVDGGSYTVLNTIRRCVKVRVRKKIQTSSITSSYLDYWWFTWSEYIDIKEIVDTPCSITAFPGDV